MGGHPQVVNDPRGSKWRILAQYGNLNQPGFGLVSTAQGLNAPYDAKVIGDFFGLTPPEEDEDNDH